MKLQEELSTLYFDDHSDIEDIWEWIIKNFISKKNLIKQIKKLQEEPTRQGIIDLIKHDRIRS
jgi:hypothetical protein